MSLPNYLAKIKSAGIYRFVWDKSVVPPQQAETLRLLVGYSEKGPFNTPVYIETIADFKSIYGNISKRLEKRGVYFHRMAEQALQAGPILALNLKPFNVEDVDYVSFNGNDVPTLHLPASKKKITVSNLYDTNRFWKLDADLLPEKLSSNVKSSDYVRIVATDIKESSCSLFIKPVKNDSYAGITFRSWYTTQNVEMPEYLECIADEDMSDYFAEVYVFKGEFTRTVCEGSLADYFVVEDKYRIAGEKETATHIHKDGKYVEATMLEKAEYVLDETDIRLKDNYTDVFGNPADVLVALANDSKSNFIGIYSGCTLPYFKDANDNYVSLDIKFNADYDSHKMLMKFDESVLEELTNEQIKEKLIISTKDDGYSPLYLQGYTYGSISKNDNVYEKCIAMVENKGLRTALTSRVDVEYHYIVDTFDTNCNENKKHLFALAKEKDNSFAIINFPKMSKFTTLDGVTDNNGSFSMEKAMEKFKMPSEFEGASYGAYYTQLTFSDGTVKSVIPSAALISNLFMEKWGPRQPYYIVAGPNFGSLLYSGLIGPDYNFSRADLDILEPKGINAIIYVPRLGTYISSNQTAKQVPVSGLSKVHIRELVIYLQNEIEHLLQSYQWELNTQPLRDTIKAKADAICETIKNNGGIYEFINICDATNNTPEVIDNEMIILDTEIEPARGAGKMVHQLTIHKTGALSSTVK